MDPATLTAIATILGVSPETLLTIIVGGLPIFDWLFGSGHAGSCGAFREQYFGVTKKLDPLMDIAQGLWSNAGVNLHPEPTEIMIPFGPAISTAVEVAWQQFDQFKGSNLLGQTMFASRLHLYLEKRWIGPALFGIAQWAQITTARQQDQIDVEKAQLTDLQNRVTLLQGQINGIPNPGGDIFAIQQQVNTLQTQLLNVIYESIPYLNNQIVQLSNTVNFNVLQRIQSLETTRTELQNALSQDVWPNINQLWQRVTQLEQSQPVDISAWITSVNTQLKSISDVINGEIKGRLANDEAWITALRNFNDTYTIPAITIQAGQISFLYDQVVNQINPRLQLAMDKIHKINRQKIPRIRQTLRGIQDQIDQIGTIPNLQDQVTRILQRITEIETQKTETILPQLGELANAVAEIVNDLNTIVHPTDAIQDQNITNIQTWIVNVAGPTIELHTRQITKIKKVLSDFVTVNLSYLITFVNNFDVQVKNVIKTSCDEIRQCLVQGTPPDDATVCEEGRKFWGMWAECWLSTFTDEPEPIIDGVLEYVDIPFLRDRVRSAAATQSTGAWADCVAIGKEVVAAGLANVLPSGGIPGADGIDGSPFIFQATP